MPEQPHVCSQRATNLYDLHTYIVRSIDEIFVNRSGSQNRLDLLKVTVTGGVDEVAVIVEDPLGGRLQELNQHMG